MIQYCSYPAARRLLEAGMQLTLSQMAYPVEVRPEGASVAPLQGAALCEAWQGEDPQGRFIVPAPTLCELLQLLPVQLNCDLLGYWHIAKYRDAIGPNKQQKHSIPVEAVAQLLIELIREKRIVVDPSAPYGPLIYYP